MSNTYMFEVPFTCKCEACGAQMTGIIKRGPLIVGSNILSSGMQTGAEIAEMKLAKSIVEGNLENRTGNGFSADTACPECGVMQSWKPVHEPKKSSYVGMYILCLIVFPLLAMLVWAIAFFDAFIPFLISMIIGVGLGIFLPLRSQLKHREGDKIEYEKALKEYKAYQDGLSKIKAESTPELDWSQARFVPVK